MRVGQIGIRTKVLVPLIILVSQLFIVVFTATFPSSSEGLVVKVLVPAGNEKRLCKDYFEVGV